MIQGIGGVQPYNYNDLNRITNDPNSSALVKKPESEVRGRQENGHGSSPAGIDLRLEDIRPRQNATLENISLSLNENAGSFEMKGRQSDITSLDMEKAVSDMQKDQALMQYQYFVGETNIVNNEDGIVIAK